MTATGIFPAFQSAMSRLVLMKHKVKVQVPVEKRGLFRKKTVMETRTIEVDSKTYKKMKQDAKNRPYSIEEMMLYDEIFDEWDD
jgi:hypothetical protein